MPLFAYFAWLIAWIVAYFASLIERAAARLVVPFDFETAEALKMQKKNNEINSKKKKFTSFIVSFLSMIRQCF